MILCYHCGNQNRDRSAFCSFCGNRLADDSYVIGHLRLLRQDQGKEYLIGREYLIADVDRCIGREAGNDIVAEDNELSAQHARIFFKDQLFWVEDLHSTNGTFVNGERITEPTRLHSGDLLRMGQTLLKFVL